MICILCCGAFNMHLYFCWYNLSTLSKDHTGNTMPTRAKTIPSNTIPYRAAHTYLAHIWKYSPPPAAATPPGKWQNKRWILLTGTKTLFTSRIVFVVWSSVREHSTSVQTTAAMELSSTPTFPDEQLMSSAEATTNFFKWTLSPAFFKFSVRSFSTCGFESTAMRDIPSG